MNIENYKTSDQSFGTVINVLKRYLVNEDSFFIHLFIKLLETFFQTLVSEVLHTYELSVREVAKVKHLFPIFRLYPGYIIFLFKEKQLC